MTGVVTGAPPDGGGEVVTGFVGGMVMGVMGVVAGLVTGELTGFVGGMVTGVVEGTSTGAAGLTGVTVTGFVAGTVTMVGVGVVGSGGADMGVVGKTVGVSNVSCEVVFRWKLLKSSLLEEGKICSSSLLSSFCAKSSMEATSAYNPTNLPVI